MARTRKQAEAVGSGVPDLTTSPARTSPIPQPSVENKPAPGQKGPAGLSGRTTYSRVNTGTPPTPDMGISAQKGQSPRGLEFLPKTASSMENDMPTNLTGRPALNDLIKSAMAGAAARVDVSLESARQIANVDGTPPARTKTASTSAAPEKRESIPTEVAVKLASALQYVAAQISPKLAADEAQGVGPGEGPGALDVTPAETSGENVDAGELGHATQQPPMSPPMQKDPTRPSDPGTGLETNEDSSHPDQPESPISNETARLTNDEVKAASAYAANLLLLGLAKVAADQHGRPQIVKTAFGSPAFAGAAKGGATGALGGGALGAGLGAVAGHLTGLGAGRGAAIGGGLGALGGGAYGAQQGAKTASRKKTASTTEVGGRIGGNVGQVAGSALAGAGAGALRGAGYGALAGAGGGAVLGGMTGGLPGALLGAGAGVAPGAYLGAGIGGLKGGIQGGIEGVRGLSQVSPEAVAPVKEAAARMVSLVKRANDEALVARGEELLQDPDLGRKRMVGAGSLIGGSLAYGTAPMHYSDLKTTGRGLLGAGVGAALAGGGVGLNEGGIEGAARGAGGAAVGSALGGAAGGIGGGAVGGTLGALGGGAIGAGLGAYGGRGGGLGGVLQGAREGALSGGAKGMHLGAGFGAGLGTAAGAYEGAGRGYQMAMQPQRDNRAMGAAIAQREAAGDKQASIYAANLRLLGLNKMAEDAINPAQIKAGKIDDVGDTPPDGAVASGEGAPAEPSDVNAQKRKMISSNEAAINYTKRDAKADPKSDLGDVIEEPALSDNTDKTLDMVLDHTDQAGAKISSAQLAKLAAARAVLSKIAQKHKVAAKKTKKSNMGGMGGGAPSTPQAASGFSAGSQM